METAAPSSSNLVLPLQQAQPFLVPSHKGDQKCTFQTRCTPTAAEASLSSPGLSLASPASLPSFLLLWCWDRTQGLLHGGGHSTSGAPVPARALLSPCAREEAGRSQQTAVLSPVLQGLQGPPEPLPALPHPRPCTGTPWHTGGAQAWLSLGVSGWQDPDYPPEGRALSCVLGLSPLVLPSGTAPLLYQPMAWAGGSGQWLRTYKHPRWPHL